MMEKLTKKEIKECKKDIALYGADYKGWWHGILEVIANIDIDVMLDIIEEMQEYGFKRSKDNFSFDNALITEFSKRIGYQEFKKILPYFLGYYGVKYENGNCVQY